MSLSLNYIYKDESILAVNKPEKLLIHYQKGFTCTDSLVDRLSLEFTHPPAPVHRLDAPTSGIVLCAFSKESASILSTAFREGRVKKTYLAIVRGWADSGIIELPLQKYHRKGEFVEARTIFKELDRLEIPVANNRFPQSRYSLLEVYPQTGRFHQIRRHLARKSFPVIGDTSHGDTRHNRIFNDHFHTDRLLLHAWKIEFQHPISGEMIKLESPVPEEFRMFKIPC